MNDSFWQGFCYHLALDYDNFMHFFYNWFTVRGLTKYFDIYVPQTPRIYISVPLNTDKRFTIHQISIDSDLSDTSLDEVDVRFEGSISTLSSSSSCELLNMKLRSTPDIVRTLKKPRKKRDPFGSTKSLIDPEIDHGFCSDASSRTALDKLDELQKQLAQMQKDIADIVQHQANESTKIDMSAIFRPIMASSPSIRAPPPPCLPPAPPPPLTPIMVKRGQSMPVNRSRIPLDQPDMSHVLKEIGSVKLRPVKSDPESHSTNFTLSTRLPLRSVTKHESIIADALRQRFQQFRIRDHSTSAADTSDEWRDDDDCNNSRHQSNAGRMLLRKVDRSQLPAAVCKDLSEEVELVVNEHLPVDCDVNE